MKFTVVLNGTDTNPYAKWGFKHNPFPQLGIAELDAAMIAVNTLGGEPLRDTDDIRTRLGDHFTAEFVDGLCERYRPGQMVTIRVEIPEAKVPSHLQGRS